MDGMDYIIDLNDEKMLIEIVNDKKKDVSKMYNAMRKVKHLTQAQVAEAMDAGRPDISRFESGRYNPTLELMVRYANALGCDLKIELVKRDREKENDRDGK